MPDGDPSYSARTVDRIGAVPAATWDSLAGGDNPFVSHVFLGILEDSDSVGAEAGWLPRHLVVEDGAGRVVGCAPLYLKGHSFGEYVFDHGWAEAYERAGGRYYPKLQCAVPFTPVPGPRLLVGGGTDAPRRQRVLAAALAGLARELGVSSLHVTFPTEPEWRELGASGYLMRHGQQFHWRNRGYGSFDDFLASLSSRKRKTIRRERRDALRDGIRIHTLTGDDLRAEHWDAFYRCYIATSDTKWGYPYLSRAFFHLLGERMADRVVLFLAERDGDWVAGALNLVGRDTLYGRNWGALGRFPFLHFEACYYRAIEYAIERGLARVEAGAQGPHKIQRGYLPTPTYSAHWIADARFREAVARFLEDERRMVDEEIEGLSRYAPYRRDGGED